MKKKINNIQFEEKDLFIDLFGEQVYLVGGTIRDFLLYKKPAQNKDIDLLVTNHSYEEIVKKLNPYGKTNTVGKSFAVVKFTRKQQTYDISIPRVDIKKSETSSSHKNFVIKSDPLTSVEEDLKRRDFTCNSMALKLIDSELIDPYQGREAINNRKITMTNPQTFIDDPLRILRCARFASVHSFQVNEEIYEKVKEVDFKDLSAERISDELIPLLLNSKKPSVGLEEYFKLTVLKKLFPDLYKLTLTIQDSEFHPETDRSGHHSVWGHTLITVDLAAELSRLFNLSSERTLTLLLAALLHDIGKSATTDWTYKRGRMTVTSMMHDGKGSQTADALLTNLKIETRNGYPLKKTIVNLIKNHHRLFDLYKNKDKISFKTISRIVRDLEGEDFLLLLLDQADRRSREGQTGNPPELDEISNWFLEKKAEWGINQDTVKPLVQGRDLIPFGIRPGKKMGEILKTLYNDQLDGKFKTLEDGLTLFKNKFSDN